MSQAGRVMRATALTDGLVPAQAPEAERSVLAAMLLNRDAIRLARAQLKARDFFSAANQRIFDAILALADRGEAADCITVTEELRKRSDLEVVGGAGTVVGILESATTSANIEEHSAIVSEAATRRRLRRLALDVQTQADDPTLSVAAILAHLEGEAADVAASLGVDGAPGVTVTRLSGVEALPVEWLWEGWIPLGMLTVLDGDPGLGKSTVTLDLAARLSRGKHMPDGSFGPGPAGAVVLSAEDDLARVIRPRLDAAGADVERIVTVTVRGVDGMQRDPTICTADLAAVEHGVREVGALLVVVDPLMAFLPAEVNAHRDQDVRRALAELRSLSERTGAAVVVIRHLNKTGGVPAIYRGGGSIGIIGAARSGLILAADPDDAEARVLAMTKCNLAVSPPALRLRLVGDPGGAWPQVAWEGATEHTAASLLAVPGDPEERTLVEEAADWLRRELDGRLVPAREVHRAALDAGLTAATLRRAKQRIGVKVEKVGQPGGQGQHWVWRLPEATHHDCPKVRNLPDLERLRSTGDGKPLSEAERIEGAHAQECEHLRQHTFRGDGHPQTNSLDAYGWEPLRSGPATATPLEPVVADSSQGDLLAGGGANA